MRERSTSPGHAHFYYPGEQALTEVFTIDCEPATANYYRSYRTPNRTAYVRNFDSAIRMRLYVISKTIYMLLRLCHNSNFAIIFCLSGLLPKDLQTRTTIIRIS